MRAHWKQAPGNIRVTAKFALQPSRPLKPRSLGLGLKTYVQYINILLVLNPSQLNPVPAEWASHISDQPWSLGAVKLRPSLESSLRAISRIRPNARKMRRRLMAFAGATDKRITGRTTNIAN